MDRGIEVAEDTTALSTWKPARRRMVMRHHVPTRPPATGQQPMWFREWEEHRAYRYSVLVTRDRHVPPEEMGRRYRPGANEETAIKEGYGWHEFNVHSFWGTEAARRRIGMVCYNRIHHLNRTVLKMADEGVVRLKTLRLNVLAIPAVDGSGGRRPTLRLGVRDRRRRGKLRFGLQRIQC
ncbi:MAG: hypothetical protein ACUVUC_16910 [Thermoguttaceae bacterium]